MNDKLTRLEIARVEMNRAVWSYLNNIMPPVYHDDEIDAARDVFINAGLDALARHMGNADNASKAWEVAEEVRILGEMIANAK